MLRIIPVLAVLACSGCFPFYIPPSGPDKPKDLADAPLEVHVKHARQAPALELMVGRLPRDLGTSDERSATFLPMALRLNDGFHEGPSSLMFLGIEEGQICFGATDHLDADSSTPAEEIGANFEKENLETMRIWIEAVESLDALTGRKAWPPGPTATRLVSAEVVGDEVKTFTEKQPIGDDGEYVEVKEDRRVVELRVCGNGFELKPGSNYLVGVMHALPSEHDEQWSPGMAELGDPDYEDGLRMQHDSLLLWVLSDDGTLDLSK